jgi:hypothetical protein
VHQYRIDGKRAANTPDPRAPYCARHVSRTFRLCNPWYDARAVIAAPTQGRERRKSQPLLPHGGAAPLKIRQLNSSKPLMISITAAVLPWMPKAAALLPPWCKTIAASPIGMIVATSINQPSGCADP